MTQQQVQKSYPEQALHFVSHRYQAMRPGTALMITGAVHGNETCGTQAIRRLIAALDSGEIVLSSGSLTLVPVCNPLAYARKERHGDRNLNRRLIPTEQAQEFEDHVANWLCPLMAQHDVLLDLHSFRGEGQPFVLVGPENNLGKLEPFRHATPELALAMRLGVRRLVDGWLSTYDKGMARRRAALPPDASALQIADADTSFGIGTTEYMRSVGGYAMTLECGSHDDPAAPEVAWNAIRRTLDWLGLTSGEPVPADTGMEALHLEEVIDKRNKADRFVRTWASFDMVSAGELIGIHADGTEVRAPFDGRIVFPDPGAEAGEEWFYLARYSSRLQGVC